MSLYTINILLFSVCIVITIITTQRLNKLKEYSLEYESIYLKSYSNLKLQTSILNYTTKYNNISPRQINIENIIYKQPSNYNEPCIMYIENNCIPLNICKGYGNFVSSQSILNNYCTINQTFVGSCSIGTNFINKCIYLHDITTNFYNCELINVTTLNTTSTLYSKTFMIDPIEVQSATTIDLYFSLVENVTLPMFSISSINNMSSDLPIYVRTTSTNYMLASLKFSTGLNLENITLFSTVLDTLEYVNFSFVRLPACTFNSLEVTLYEKMYVPPANYTTLVSTELLEITPSILLTMQTKILLLPTIDYKPLASTLSFTTNDNYVMPICSTPVYTDTTTIVNVTFLGMTSSVSVTQLSNDHIFVTPIVFTGSVFSYRLYNNETVIFCYMSQGTTISASISVYTTNEPVINDMWTLHTNYTTLPSIYFLLYTVAGITGLFTEEQYMYMPYVTLAPVNTNAIIRSPMFVVNTNIWKTFLGSSVSGILSYNITFNNNTEYVNKLSGSGSLVLENNVPIYNVNSSITLDTTQFGIYAISYFKYTFGASPSMFTSRSEICNNIGTIRNTQYIFSRDTFISSSYNGYTDVCTYINPFIMSILLY